MRHVLVGLTVLATLTTGCTYSTARLDYERHPELRSVRLWKVDSALPGGTNLGPVEAQRGGWTGCDAMATDATLDLLNDARARGGARVDETRYESAAYWSGYPHCRRNWALLGYMTVRTSGVAVKDTRQSPTAGVSSKPTRRLERAKGSGSRSPSRH
jgi:hypothetical protein